MERYDILRETANKKLLIADRFLNFTYRVVNEPKLLLGVVENLLMATVDMMSAMLYFELKYKFVPLFREDLRSKLETFRPLLQKFPLPYDSIGLIESLNKIVVSHKTCPTEFVKDKSIIMCSKDFECERLNFEIVQSYFKKAKVFIEGIDKIIEKNERDYRRFS